MINFLLIVVLAFSLAVFASPSDGSTVDQVVHAVEAIKSSVATLDNEVQQFTSASGLPGAFKIHEDSVKLETTLKQSITVVENTGPVSVSDASPILKIVQSTLPTIEDALSAIITKKGVFEGLPLRSSVKLVKTDLEALFTAATDFGSALIEATPSELKGDAVNIKATIDTAFHKATDAYADV